MTVPIPKFKQMEALSDLGRYYFGTPIVPYSYRLEAECVRCGWRGNWPAQEHAKCPDGAEASITVIHTPIPEESAN